MARDTKGLFRRQIRTLFEVGAAAGLTDGQLLERFATRRDEGAELAFAALVERHGPMVLRVCRGILRDDHEAMDAFQATFLVLATKGGSLWVRDSLGPWLHRVACRASGRAKRTAARRRATERRAAEMAETRNGGDDHKELASAIHEEVNRLPERFRSPVVLCDLEGRTCEEAARHLGCPVGTVGSRLARGRQRLRDRLRRRGLAPNVGLLAATMKWQGPGASIPPELVSSTAVSAVQFFLIRAVSQGTASSLAIGVLRAMTMTRWWNVASILFVLGASTTGVISIAARNSAVAELQTDDPPRAARFNDVALSEIKPGKLSVIVEERGSLEASRKEMVFSRVEGSTTIISIVPEGTRVTRGQLVCELDSASLRDQLVHQEIATRGAEANFQNAKLAREVAEIAIKEYTDGVYPHDHLNALGEIERARSAITKTEERVKRTRNAREQLSNLLSLRDEGRPKTSADIVARLDLDDRLDEAEQTLARERRALEIGQTKLKVLEEFTRPKTIKALESEAGKVRSREQVLLSVVALENSKRVKLERQIASCKLLAPADGTVVYANDPSRFGGQNRPQIEEGATVRERQIIFYLPDFTRPMRVNAKIHESIVDRLRPGLTARVKVDAFPDQTFTGVVEDVAPLPDPSSYFSSDIKVYTTHVTIEKGLPGLRPGITAQVEILVSELDNVLSVPTQAVVWYDGKDHLAVKKPDGGIDWREVTLGLSNGKEVEVKEGLKSGETVAIDPSPLLSDEQKQRMALSPTRPAPAPRKVDKGSGSLKARRKGFIIPSELRTKLQAIGAEDRAKVMNGTPEEREAILKKAGLTDDEVRQYNELRERSNVPR